MLVMMMPVVPVMMPFARVPMMMAVMMFRASGCRMSGRRGWLRCFCCSGDTRC